MPVVSEVAHLRAENEMLRDRLDAFKREFLGDDIPFPLEWGLARQERRILALLMRRPVASYDQINTALYRFADHEPEHPEWVIRKIISRMRARLQHLEIEIIATYGVGYALPVASKLNLQAHLAGLQ